MRSAPPSQRKLDFEDVFAMYESGSNTGFSKPPSTTLAKKKTSRNEGAGDETRDIEPELRALHQELVDHIVNFRRLPHGSQVNSEENEEKAVHPRISTEVFRTEVRTTLSQLRSLQETPLQNLEELPSAQQSTFRSMRRRLAEASAELSLLRKNHKLVEYKNRRLEEKVELLMAKQNTSEKINSIDSDEAQRLREENKGLRKACEASGESNTLAVPERKRFQQTISRLRAELQDANHLTTTALLTAANAERQCEDLRKRAAEYKASSSAIDARVKELHDVQDAMLALVHSARDSTHTSAFRKNMAALGERRSRLVGRIVNTLTKRRGEESNAYADIRLPSDTASPNADTKSPTTNKETMIAGGRHEYFSAETNEVDAEDTHTPKKPILNGLRKIGSDLSRIGTQRSPHKALSQETLSVNVEKSRIAMENDCSLRKVIELKERELERMEDELFAANETAAALRVSLRDERHRRRLQSRTTDTTYHASDPESNFAIAPASDSTVFDWQTDHIEPLVPREKPSAPAPRDMDHFADDTFQF